MELRHFRDGTIFILGAIAALKVGSLVVSASVIELTLIACVILVFGWVIWAGKYWWIPVLAGATVGGTLSFGFKLYPLDIAVALAVLAIFPLMLLNHGRIYQEHRRPLTLAFYALAFFIPVRIFLDLHSQGGLTNMSRLFFDMEWPFLFSWLFYYYAKTSILNVAIVLVAIVTAVRILIVEIAIYHSSIIYIPGINYVISVGDPFSELRGCSYFLMVTLLLLSQASSSVILRILIYLMTMGAGCYVMMGGSRLECAFLLFLPFVFFAACRKWLLLLLVLFAGIAVFGMVNFYPGLLDRFPESMARGLSGLIIKQESVEIAAKNVASTDWHAHLREEGYRRWSTSLKTFLIGDDLKPFRLDSYYMMGQNDEESFRIAASADVGKYESGLWTVLATLGAIGYLLYLAIFFSFWAYTIPYLWNNKIRTLKDGFIFWATYSSVMWALFGFIAGGYPSLEIALLVMAVAVIQDQNGKEQLPPESTSRVRREIAYA